MLGRVTRIEEVANKTIAPIAPMNGKGGSLGMMQMLSTIGGGANMDGYMVETDQHTFHVLIDNGQSCCESWGYLASEDDLSQFIGADLLAVDLVDTALNQAAVEKSGWYGGDEGGIQFVNFTTARGVFQLAVYNAHNGYYGHGIVIAKDDEVLLNDVL